jgi:uncharacterized membrane protein YecN with MAPEG domain
MAEAFVFSPCEVTGRRQRNAQTTHTSRRRVHAMGMSRASPRWYRRRTVTSATSATPIFTAVLLLLVTLLAINVSALRIRLKVSLGDGGNKTLGKAIRAHANALEHCVPFILLLLFREQQAGCTRELVAIGTAFVLARVAHAAGMLGGPFGLRRLGASLTIVLELWLTLALLRTALA